MRGPAGCLMPLFMLLLLAACSDSSDTTGDSQQPGVSAAIEACDAAAATDAMLCAANCQRLADAQQADACSAGCVDIQAGAEALCALPPAQFTPCADGDCATAITRCLETAAGQHDACQSACAAGNEYCRNRCLGERAAAETSCGFLPAAVAAGSAALPVFDAGHPAVLPALLDDAELAVVEAADQRALSHRQREVRLWTGAPDTPVTVTQVEHGFRFGVPLDSREFEPGDGRLAYYGDIARRHASLLVAATSLKWRNTEREQGQRTFELADFELD